MQINWQEELTIKMNDCIFCKIVKGEIPCVKIWEDEKYLAFLDVNPVNPGHTLLIPKKHDDYLFNLSDDEYTELMLHAKVLARKLKEKLNPRRIGMAVEGFAVHHGHIHLIPLNQVNELNQQATNMNVEELNEIAQKIRK